jgi:hypothetical protein
MNAYALPKCRQYEFKVELGLNPRYALSAGEMAEFLADGLLAVDEAGLLFPGVSIPGHGERLWRVSVEALGFARTATATESDRSIRLLAARAPRNKSDQRRWDSLTEAGAELGVAILRQRMLEARLGALEEEFAPSAAEPQSPEARAALQAALAAVQRLVALTDEVLDPILGPYPPE